MQNLKFTSRVKEGKLYSTKRSGDLRVVEYINENKSKVEFITTGYTRFAQASCIINGSVNDPYYPRICGVGYTGEGPHRARPKRKLNPAYSCWTNILSRCYNPDYKEFMRYGGSGIVVSPDWYNFQNFADWFFENYRKGYHIDKDILSGVSKVYSKETCCFIPASLNVLLVGVSRATAGCKQGVELVDGKYYCTKVMHRGTYHRLGCYRTYDEANKVYKEAKLGFVSEALKDYYQSGEIDHTIYNRAICNLPAILFGE